MRSQARLLTLAPRLTDRQSKERTWSRYFHVTAAVPIVAGSGTGSYRGIGGSFSLTLTGNEDQKTPPCGPPFVRQNPRHDRLGDRLILTAVDVGADR